MTLDTMPITPIMMEGAERSLWLETAGDLLYQDGVCDEAVEVVIAYDDAKDGTDHMFVVIGEVWAGFGYTPRQAAEHQMKAKEAANG